MHPTKGPKLSSGLFRLSCPLLVRAIDEWESEGGVRELSDWLREGRAEENGRKRGYERANEIQKEIREALVDDGFSGRGPGRSELVSKLGEHNARRFLESGVAGIPPDQTWEAKCVHAHVADHLCRRSSSEGGEDDGEDGNAIGKHALRVLQHRRGVPISGNDVCWQQCDARRERLPSDWRYVSKKNRRGLRSTRLRRKELREEES